MKYKMSFYNHSVKYNNNYIFYNSLNGALVQISPKLNKVINEHSDDVVAVDIHYLKYNIN